MSARRQPTSSDDRLTAIHEQLVHAVEDLVTSEAWTAMLRIAARFRTYSASNVLLIATQRADATRVAGIRTWNSLGRRVIKGEHGIAILAPCLYKHADETERPREPASDAEPAKRDLRGFRVVPVFDVSQTTGADLPNVAPELLASDAPDGLWDHLVSLVASDGYTIDRGPCPAGVNGYTDPNAKHVRIDASSDDAQAVKTLAHELGHIRAEHATRFPDYSNDRVCRGQAEIEAESIAYVVTGSCGMGSEQYSVPYVTGWASGDLQAVRVCVTRVVNTAHSLLPRAAHDVGGGAVTPRRSLSEVPVPPAPTL